MQNYAKEIPLGEVYLFVLMDTGPPVHLKRIIWDKIIFCTLSVWFIVKIAHSYI